MQLELALKKVEKNHVGTPKQLKEDESICERVVFFVL